MAQPPARAHYAHDVGYTRVYSFVVQPEGPFFVYTSFCVFLFSAAVFAFCRAQNPCPVSLTFLCMLDCPAYLPFLFPSYPLLRAPPPCRSSRRHRVPHVCPTRTSSLVKPVFPYPPTPPPHLCIAFFWRKFGYFGSLWQVVLLLVSTDLLCSAIRSVCTFPRTVCLI